MSLFASLFLPAEDGSLMALDVSAKLGDLCNYPSHPCRLCFGASGWISGLLLRFIGLPRMLPSRREMSPVSRVDLCTVSE